jgi:hypothetical protein
MFAPELFNELVEIRTEEEGTNFSVVLSRLLTQ